MNILIMAEKRSRGNDILQQISKLSDDHEIILLKRHAIMQIQKHRKCETKYRRSEKRKTVDEANKMSKQLLDDISIAERHLKNATYSVSENRLDLLKDHYFEFVKAKCSDWLKDVETLQDDSSSVNS